MKSVFMSFFILTLCSLNGEIFSDLQGQERVYVKAEQVFIEQNNILICYEGNFMSVIHLGNDQNGLYFTIEKPQAWHCEVCGNDNAFWVNICPGCYFRRY